MLTRPPVDLARVQAALARLDALVTSGEVDAGRTAAWLSGDLDEGPSPMTTRDDIPTSLRVPRSLLDRADALCAPMADYPPLMAITGPRGVSRSAVLRLAVELGISALEAGEKPVLPGGVQGLRSELEAMRAHVDRLLETITPDESEVKQ